MQSGSGKYDDLIDLPRPPSGHAPMSRIARAAQFAPFAALTGYDAVVEETARLTDRRIELTDEHIAAINAKLSYLAEHIDTAPPVTVTYFLPDRRKNGGEYVTVSGVIDEIDEVRAAITLACGTCIPMGDLLALEFTSAD